MLVCVSSAIWELFTFLGPDVRHYLFTGTLENRVHFTFLVKEGWNPRCRLRQSEMTSVYYKDCYNALQPEHQRLTGWFGKPTDLATDSLVFLFISIDTQTHILIFFFCCKEIKGVISCGHSSGDHSWNVVGMKCSFIRLSKVIFIRLLSPVYLIIDGLSGYLWARCCQWWRAALYSQ